MTAHVLSVNVGSAEPNGAKTTPTGIRKRPIDSVEVRAPGPKHGGRGSGVIGDFIGDRDNHGGDFQAVYAVAREELDWWGSRLGRALHPGMFGENLTTTGIDVDHALIGERWQVGAEVVLTVRGPRIPCGTFAQHMGERGWLKTFVAHGLSGAYLSVEVPGTIRTGDPITVLSTPDHGVQVPTVFRAFYGDVDALRAVVAEPVLDPVEHAALSRRLVEELTRRAGSASRGAS